MSNENRPAKELGKSLRMLKLFTEGKKLHRFSAEVLGDHCLPTTISDLQQSHNIWFSRKTVKVPNRFGGKSRVSLYWLESVALAKSKAVLSTKGAI